MTPLTFESLLTPAGMAVAAALLVTLVEIVKVGLPIVDRHVSGATLAFLLSAALYIVAAVVLPNATPDLYLAAFCAWIMVAAGAMGIKSGAMHIGAVRDGTAGLPDVAPIAHTDADESPQIAAAEIPEEDPA